MAEVEIKPGPELDQAVAMACGMHSLILESFTDDYGSHGECCVVGVAPDLHRFEPSTDADWAFEAAEKVGLFRMFYRFLSDGEMGGYVIYESTDDGYSEIATGDTPALAICAAILKLKSTEPRNG